MSLYSRLCFASSAVSLGTVGLLVWIASPTQAETGYVYFSLAAPTLALSHHVLYFLGPSCNNSKTPVYALVPPLPPSDTDASPSGAATPTTKFRISRICQRYATTGWKQLLRSVVTSDEEERNPTMASSTLSIIVLIFLAVLVGAFAISSGAVALLDVLDTVSAQKTADRLSALPTDSTSIDVPAPMSEYSGLDSTVPPTPILALQAGLSLMQAILLGSLALVGMRIRATQSSDGSSMADDESGLDIEWVYEDDECVEENK